MRRTPDARADEFDGGEVVFGAFVIAGGNTTEVFDAVEEPFDEVALPAKPAAAPYFLSSSK
jgi:hypothetical protein